MASIAITKKWELWRNNENSIARKKVCEEIIDYPFNNIGFHKSMLAMLYWAEGTRCESTSGVRFANTDPRLTFLFVSLLRKCFKIDEKKIKVRLHIHYYHSATQSILYWSKILNVPKKQFGKIYRKKRSKTKKFRKNFAGICFISYGDSKIRRELMVLGEEIYKKLNVPVA